MEALREERIRERDKEERERVLPGSGAWAGADEEVSWWPVASKQSDMLIRIATTRGADAHVAYSSLLGIVAEPIPARDPHHGAPRHGRPILVPQGAV